MNNDYEKIVFTTILKGEKRHYCPNWDFMAIDEHCPEFDGCTCFSSTVTKENDGLPT